MFRVIFNSERCKGCEHCVNNCPKKIIHLSKSLNSKGYFTAQISTDDEAKCIGCASCGKICPDSVITIEKVEEENNEQ